MNENIDIQEYLSAHELDAQAIYARATAVHREHYELRGDFGFADGILAPRLRDGGGLVPTVGDYVRLEPRADVYLIVETLPRRTFFARSDPDPMVGEQAVAANFDTVCILTSANQEFNVKRIERYLVQAFSSGAVPMVVLTKCDLTDEPARYVREVEALGVGAAVHALSTYTGEGVAEFARCLRPGGTLVFLGSSGVGKSSLLNALCGERRMAVGEIRFNDGRGRHTTTHRQMIALPGGAQIIDTPGMRMLGMWDASAGMETMFPDVEQLVDACRFADCKHAGEPGCAVRAALDAGTLDPARLEAYLQLRFEDELSRRRAARQQRLARHQADRQALRDRARRPRQKRFDFEE